MTNKKLLEKIKVSRLVKGITQEDMAKKLEISAPSYSRFERGITKTDLKILKKVFLILDMDLQDLGGEFLDFISASNKDLENMVRLSTNSDIRSQLRLIIELFEEQQSMNALILEKLKLMECQLV